MLNKKWGKFVLGAMFCSLGLAADSFSGQSGHGKTAAKPQAKPKTDRKRTAANPEPYILVGAGDIAGCSTLPGAIATGKLIERIPGTVFAAGDLAYDRGTSEEFGKCYDLAWGKFKERTRPVPGNHEYATAAGLPYFAYWGARAGPAGKGYYSFDLGNWHVVALNSNCSAPGVGGCGTGSAQEKWLKQDLAEHPKSCIVAYAHHALYSSGILERHALHPELRDLWRDLYQAHADLMLAGHEHSYERFAPQDPQGQRDERNGIREIVVGTGGRSHDPLGLATNNSEQRNADTFGVLKLTLFPAKYTWEFVPVNGEEGFHDAGEATCHNAPLKPGFRE
jgi:calcineurin-like phosphoesterase family protein